MPSEPRIFWDGNPKEAADIISRIDIPEHMGTLEPAGTHLNGPSAKVLDNQILAPLGFTREDAWLCDLLPETRLNPNQFKVIQREYEPKAKLYGLNEVTIPVLQFLNRVVRVNYKSLQEYVDLYGYGNYSQTAINGKTYNIIPLAHPRQIGALGAHSGKWYMFHQEWEKKQR